MKSFMMHPVPSSRIKSKTEIIYRKTDYRNIKQCVIFSVKINHAHEKMT